VLIPRTSRRAAVVTRDDEDGCRLHPRDRPAAQRRLSVAFVRRPATHRSTVNPATQPFTSLTRPSSVTDGCVARLMQLSCKHHHNHHHLSTKSSGNQSSSRLDPGPAGESVAGRSWRLCFSRSIHSSAIVIYRFGLYMTTFKRVLHCCQLSQCRPINYRNSKMKLLRLPKPSAICFTYILNYYYDSILY